MVKFKKSTCDYIKKKIFNTFQNRLESIVI